MRWRWNWGHGMAAVYAVFAIATSGVVAFSMRERVDLVSSDYYERAVALDSRRQAEARAAALGGAFAMSTDAGNQRVVVTWPRDVPIESGTLTLYRPSDATRDRATAVAPDGEARQIVSLAGLVPGRWMLQVDWRARGQSYYAEREIIVGAGR